MKRPLQLQVGPEHTPLNSKIVRRTLLSTRPSKSAPAVAALSVGVLFFFSWVYWNQFNFFSPETWIGNPKKVFVDGEIWRLFTASLIHQDMRHLLSNALPFSVLSYLLFGYFGYTAHPWITFFGGALVNALSLYTYDPENNLLGASGMVYLMGAAWLVIFIGVERRLLLRRRLLFAAGVGAILLFPSSVVNPNVSYRTHLIGFIVGSFLGYFIFRLNLAKIRSEEIVEYLDEEGDAIPHVLNQ